MVTSQTSHSKSASTAPLFLVALLLFIFPFDQALKLSNLVGSDLPIRLSQILALIIIGRFLLFGGGPKVKLWSWTATLFAVYVALNVFSLTYVPNQEYAFRQLLVLLSWPVMYLALITGLRHQNEVPTIIRLMIISAYISFTFSILQVLVFWTTGITLGILPEETGDHLRGRAYGFYLEPNWFGVYQIVLLPLLLWAYKNPDRVGIKKDIQFFGLLIFSASFILSQNRGAMIALLVQGAFFLVYLRDRNSNTSRTVLEIRRTIAQATLLALAAVGALVALIALSPGDLQGSIVLRLVNNIISTEESASSGRLIAYKVMWDSFLSSPITGHGLASWATLVQGWRIVEDSVVQANITAPNEYLRLLAEDGIVGFLLVAGMVGLILKKLFRAKHQADFQLPGLMAAFILSFVGFLCTGNFYGVRGMINALPVFGLYVATANLMLKSSEQIEVDAQTLQHTKTATNV